MIHCFLFGKLNLRLIKSFRSLIVFSDIVLNLFWYTLIILGLNLYLVRLAL
jgi:hypothetical protein